MKKILISHSEDDRQYVEQLAKELETHGVASWYGVYFHGNDRYKEKVKQLVRDASAVIVVWSDSSLHSRHVVHAAREAGAMGKLISTGLESSLGPMTSPRPYGKDYIDLEDRRQLLKSIASHGFSIKGVADVLSESAIYYYMMIGICLAASLWSSSFYMKALCLSPILVGLCLFRDKDKCDDPARARVDLIGTAVGVVVLAGLTIKMGIWGVDDAEFIFCFFAFDILNKRIARVGVVHFIPDSLQWQGNPHDARIFTQFLKSIILAALAPLFLEILSSWGVVSVNWVNSSSVERFILAAWFVFFVFFHFHARRRALEFFQLSGDSQRGFRIPRTRLQSEALPYISLVFYGSLLVPALYLTLFARDMWVVVLSWVFLWITSNVYAWRRADIRGVLVFKE